MDQKPPEKDALQNENVQGETKTSIDALLELLKNRGRCELTGVSVELGVSPNIVESWAKILERGKLVRISYELGKMYMEPLRVSAEEQDALRATTQIKQTGISEDVEMERLALEHFTKDMEKLSKTVSDIETVYKQRLPQVQKIFTDLDRLYTPVEQKGKELENIKNNSVTYVSTLEKRINEIYAKINVLESTDHEKAIKGRLDRIDIAQKKAILAKDSIRELEDTKEAFYESLEAEMELRTKEFKRMIKRSVNDIYSSIKAEGVAADDALDIIIEDATESKSTLENIKQFNREIEEYKRKIDATRTEFKDKYEHTSEEMLGYSKIFEKEYDEAKKTMQEMRNALGDSARLDESVRNARDSIAEINKGIANARKEIIEILEQSRALDAANISTEKKAELIDELKKKSNEVRANAEEIRSALDETYGLIVGKNEKK